MGVEDPMLVVDRFCHSELLRWIQLLPQGAQPIAGKVLLDQCNQLSFAGRPFLRWQHRGEWLQLFDRQHIKRLVHGGNGRGVFCRGIVKASSSRDLCSLNVTH